MPAGTLEVHLVSARGLKRGDLFSKSDPYAILKCGNQTQESNVARNQGSNPTWNQRFVFLVEEGVLELTLRIMDKDFFTADDELGTVRISLANVLQVGNVPTGFYSVVTTHGRFHGEVKLSLTFTPKRQDMEYRGSIYSSKDLSHGQIDRGLSGSSESYHHLCDGPYGSDAGGGWSRGYY